MNSVQSYTGKANNVRPIEPAALTLPSAPQRRAANAPIHSRKPYADSVIDRLLIEGRLTPTQRPLAGIVTVPDDSMSPLLSEHSRFVAVPVKASEYPSLIGKVVAVVIKAPRFYCYLGRLVEVNETSLTVSRENDQWPTRTESRSVIRSINRVVSVLENPVC